jgi:ABC-type uncharacterized transport system involved in gliding motility auxiliary subunit
MGMRPGRLISLLPFAGLTAWAIALAQALVNQGLDTWSYAFIGAGLFCFVLFGAVHPPSRRLVTIARRSWYILALVAAVVLLNLAALHFFFRLDLTELRGYSLSPETLNALTSLQEPLNITAFLSKTDYRGQLASKLLGEYAAHSRWISYQVIDPDLQPSAMQQKGVDRYGTLLFEQATKRREINSVDEQSMTSAILHLSEDRPRKVYFLSGHGERDLESPRREGYNVLKWYLQNKGYTVETLNSNAAATWPDDMDALVVAGPRQSFSQTEQDLLDSYLQKGGRLLLLLDPGLPNPFPPILEKWGVRVGDNMIFDPKSSFFGDPATPLISQFGPSPITRSLSGMNTFFPLAREVDATGAVPEGIDVTSFLQTSDKSWAENNLKEPQATFDPAEDKAGPISLAANVRATLAAGRGAEAAKARLAVFGDSDFASNAALSSADTELGNAALFNNTISWLVEDDQLINLKPASTEARRVILTGQQMRLIGYATILFVPLTIVLVGALVWWRRSA